MQCIYADNVAVCAEITQLHIKKAAVKFERLLFYAEFIIADTAPLVPTQNNKNDWNNIRSHERLESRGDPCGRPLYFIWMIDIDD